MRARTAAAGIAASAAAAAIVYRRVIEPWHQRWGAIDDEVAAELPGDDLVPEPASQITRAITIAAPPAAVWPWLVQIGADRAGFYSYDWLENLFGLRIHSADRIVDDWQELAVGDFVAASRSRSGEHAAQLMRRVDRSARCGLTRRTKSTTTTPNDAAGRLVTDWVRTGSSTR